MIRSPLTNETLFTIGPVPITEPVVVTWGLMAALALGGFLATRSLALAPSRMQTVLEVIVGAIEDQIRDTMRTAPGPYPPLLGTLFLFILIANWSSLIPGIDPPTAHLETDAALALIVFLAVIWFGMSGARRRRLLRDLRRADHRSCFPSTSWRPSPARFRSSCVCSATS